MFEKLAVLAVLLMAVGALELVRCQGAVEKRGRPQGPSNDDFEKFFLKASKSVPRIGRRRVEDQPAAAKLPLWAELSDLYEYNPELFASPQLLARWLGYYNSQLPREDARTPDDALEMRYKRSGDAELYEYRAQP